MHIYTCVCACELKTLTQQIKVRVSSIFMTIRARSPLVAASFLVVLACLREETLRIRDLLVLILLSLVERIFITPVLLFAKAFALLVLIGTASLILWLRWLPHVGHSAQSILMRLLPHGILRIEVGREGWGSATHVREAHRHRRRWRWKRGILLTRVLVALESIEQRLDILRGLIIRRLLWRLALLLVLVVEAAK